MNSKINELELEHTLAYNRTTITNDQETQRQVQE